MIKVYKTNVSRELEAESVLLILSHHFPYASINFDLEDVDKILRVEVKNEEENLDQFIKTLIETGLSIEELKD